MSEYTPCNYCTLKQMRREHKGKKIKLAPNEEYGGTDVFVDGVFNTWFKMLPRECQC